MHIHSLFPLQKYNTFGLAAYAEKWVEIHTENELQNLIQQGFIPKDAPIRVWGGGSNILLTQDIKGWVLKNNIQGFEIEKEDAETVQIAVGSGVIWHEFVLYCIEKGWGGVENLSLIPGCVGAAPMQNIGAYGMEIKDVCVYTEGYFLRTGEKKRFTNAECQFGYRESIFKREIKDFMITKVCFELKKNPILYTEYGDIQKELAQLPYQTYSIRDVSNAVIHIRQSKLPNPAEIGNAGSFFKNPTVSRTIFTGIQAQYPEMPHYNVGEDAIKIPAAWLIQQCNWKGKRFGNYGVHEKQALVLVNYGGAKGADILDLSSQIIASVKATFGIDLEREVNIM